MTRLTTTHLIATGTAVAPLLLSARGSDDDSGANAEGMVQEFEVTS